VKTEQSGLKHKFVLYQSNLAWRYFFQFASL